jgi:hypothetical protein
MIIALTTALISLLITGIAFYRIRSEINAKELKAKMIKTLLTQEKILSKRKDIPALITRSIKIYLYDTEEYIEIKDISMTAKQIINLLENEKRIIKGATEEESKKPHWTLFEINNDYFIERPILFNESVQDIINGWYDHDNGWFRLRNYNYKYTLYKNIQDTHVPELNGEIWIKQDQEWSWEHIYLKGMYIFVLDRNSGNSNILCSLMNFDLYTLIKDIQEAPVMKNLCFAMKTNVHDDLDENIVFFGTKDRKQFTEWVLLLRRLKFAIQDPSLKHNLFAINRTIQ